MIKLKHLVLEEQGIHARPTTVLVSTAKKYHSDIILRNGSESVDMKNLFQLMKSGVKQNDIIEIEISGEDEAQAAKDVEVIISAL